MLRWLRASAGWLHDRWGALYTPDGVTRLVDAVNARLRERQPMLAAERGRLQTELREVRHRLDGLRRFVEQGDTSSKVRQWLIEAERDEERLPEAIGRLAADPQQRPLQVHPRVVESYLHDLRGTLLKGGPRSRQVLQGDVERIVIHLVRSEAAKPFARAEVITTGKGLLDRVAFVVAGAGYAECYTTAETYWMDLR